MAKQIGALWVKEYTKEGKTTKMLSGRLDLGAFGEVDIAIFPNDAKKDNQPDYRIVLSERKNGKGAETNDEKGEMKPF